LAQAKFQIQAGRIFFAVGLDQISAANLHPLICLTPENKAIATLEILTSSVHNKQISLSTLKSSLLN